MTNESKNSFFQKKRKSGKGETKGTKNEKMPFKGFAFWFMLMALFLVLFHFLASDTSTENLSYNPDFVQLVENGRVRSCEIVKEVSGVEYITGELNELDQKTGANRQFRVDLVITDELISWLKENNVNFTFDPQNPLLWNILSGIVPFILVMAIIYFIFMRQMKSAGKGAMSFGKSRAKMLAREKHDITFDNVAGVDEAKEELNEVVEFLRDPSKFQHLGGKMPKGVLLVGPPGTGKTLLAKAVAGEADVPFLSISGSDFIEMFVGVGASRMRDMFTQAKKTAPCIIFIDEIDAVGRARFSGVGSGHDEREQTLNALLVEMDGFETQEGIVIVAATNRPDVLDPALTRPGRFDRQVVVNMPDLDGRAKILKIHANQINLSEDVDLYRVARGTPGFSGADLMNLMNESALLAARRSADAVELCDLEEARDKVRWGRERRSHVLDEEEKRLTAFHEAGHAVVLYKTEKTEPLHKVTIIPRGQALGATMQLPEKDRYTQGRKRLQGMLVGLMGGRVAEELFLDDITTGAQNDLQRSTAIARAMVTQYGMSENLGPQYFEQNQEIRFLGRELDTSRNISEKTSQKIDLAVAKIMQSAYEEATSILKENGDNLKNIAQLLIERETLTGEQVKQIIEDGYIKEDSEPEKEESDLDESTENASPEGVGESNVEAESADKDEPEKTTGELTSEE